MLHAGFEDLLIELKASLPQVVYLGWRRSEPLVLCANKRSSSSAKLNSNDAASGPTAPAASIACADRVVV
jgi:hypothetical protein